MNPPPGATTTAAPFALSGRKTVIVGSVTSLTRVGVTPPYDLMSFSVASDFGTAGVGGPSGQSLRVTGSGAANDGALSKATRRKSGRDFILGAISKDTGRCS